MADLPESATIRVRCPHCRKGFRAGADAVGKKARCPQCQGTFEILQSPDRSGDPAVSAGTELCAICQSPVAAGQATARCPQCRTLFHAECWDYNAGCAIYGCPEAPPTEPLGDLEIPPGHWGAEEKACPRCHATIRASAIRCRSCGATFESAAPQSRQAFLDQAMIESRLPAIRRQSVWLLVFGALTCTAPFAAVVGGIWIWIRRKEISSLPPLHAALCRLAVGIAVVQTVILALACMVHSMSNN